MTALTHRQQELLNAVKAAAKDTQTRMALILVYANRYACSGRDIKVVEEAIVGGRIVECRG